MAISYVAQGGAAAVATTGAPAYPASLVSGDYLLLWVCSDASGIGDPAGWTLVGSGNGGGMWCKVFAKVSAGTETGTVSVTAAGTKGEAHISQYRGTTQISCVGFTFGADTDSSSTAFSATGASLTTLTNDCIVENAALLAPTASYSSGNISPALSGQTGTFTGRFASRTGSNTVLYQHGDFAVSSGGTAAPVVTGTTAGANAQGVAAFTVLRESSITASTSGSGALSAMLTPAVTATTAGSGTISATQSSRIIASLSGAGAITGFRNNPAPSPTSAGPRRRTRIGPPRSRIG